MKWGPLTIAALLGLVRVVPVPAQVEQATLDSLRRVVERLDARLDSLEAGLCSVDVLAGAPRRSPTGNVAVDSLAAALDRLELKLRAVAVLRCPRGPVPPVRADSVADELAALRAAAAAAAQAATPPEQRADTTLKKPVEFVSRQRNLSALNPEISATGDVRLVARDEAPQRDNGVAREFEFSFQSALDPFSHTKLFLSFEQEEIGVEEAYVYWTGLPGRFRVDVGKFRQQVGELNRWHLHALPETEYPLVYRRFLGEEGLSGVGVALYTLLPVSVARGSHEIFLQGTSVESDPLLAAGRQPTLLARLQNFWQLSRSTYLQAGLTALGGNNRDADLRSRVLGVDLRFSYRPPSEGTRRDLTARAEGYRFHAVEGGTPSSRYGTFVDLQFRASRRWVVGARYDYVEAPRGPSGHEWGIAPAITWWQSEFVYLRLQGEHGRTLGETRDLLSFQVVWAVGPHKHETF